MEDVLKIASYICDRYYKEYGHNIDEMKLHKLLYLTQRETIIQTGEPLFNDQFEAWKYGPVLYAVHKYFQSGDLHEKLSIEAIEKYKPIFDKIFSIYAPKKSWSLSTLTHGEYSWQKAREGYAPDASCKIGIKTENIRVDADRIKTRRAMLRALGLHATSVK